MKEVSLIPVCETHGIEKAFYRNQRTGKGQWTCSGCQKDRNQKWKEGKAEREKQRQLNPVCLCTRCGAECPGAWHARRTCVSCQRDLGREGNRRHRENNPDARRKEYERHHARYQERAKEYAKKNPHRVRAAQQAWRERNPGLANAIRAERRGKGDCTIKLDAIDKAIIKAIYDKRDRTGLGGGLGPGHYNVDHIHPLALGGVHAPWNMQILSWEENASKKAKRPTLREVLRGERRYHLLRLVFLAHASTVGATA